MLFEIAVNIVVMIVSQVGTYFLMKLATKDV